jgi:phosphate/sulfate permease
MNADFFLSAMTVLSFMMSFAIGSNETDALATAFSSGALTLPQSVGSKD